MLAGNLFEAKCWRITDGEGRKKYLVHLPSSVYLGWITIATIANVTALLVDINWNAPGLGEQFWAVAVIIVGIAIALSILFTRKDTFYCLVVDWTLLGILLKRLSFLTVPAHSVKVVTIVSLVLITGAVITQLEKRRISQHSTISQSG